MKIVNTLFPINTQLTIAQLEEYNIVRFLSWIIKNYTKRNISDKKPLKATAKIKLIAIFSLTQTTLFCFLSFLINPLLPIIILLILLTNPFLIITTSILLIKPHEYIVKYLIFRKTKQKINLLKQKGLKIIAITGSFGKTSTKEMLYQIIRRKYKTLKTPESYNTLLGIAKVIDLELDEHYEIFICEMAAYKKGEIKRLTQMVPPDYGVITGITSQHLEKFGNVKNIIKAKFELWDAIQNENRFVFNTKNRFIKEETTLRQIKQKQKSVKISNIKFSKKGSQFNLIINEDKFAVQTKLFGYANIQNIALSAKIALMLGLDPKDIVNQIINLKPSENRFSLKKLGKAVIIDNTYSSNIKSFKQMLKTARALEGKKTLVTPGVVELGRKEIIIHKKLGMLSKNTFDKIILVGTNNKTKSLAKALNEPKKIEFIKDERTEYIKKIKELSKQSDWIFLENDVTQNY